MRPLSRLNKTGSRANNQDANSPAANCERAPHAPPARRRRDAARKSSGSGATGAATLGADNISPFTRPLWRHSCLHSSGTIARRRTKVRTDPRSWAPAGRARPPEQPDRSGARDKVERNCINLWPASSWPRRPLGGACRVRRSNRLERRARRRQAHLHIRPAAR